jgi:hypothetical protein
MVTCRVIAFSKQERVGARRRLSLSIDDRFLTQSINRPAMSSHYEEEEVVDSEGEDDLLVGSKSRAGAL